MVAEQFAMMIESSFGSYKEGMKETIKQRLQRMPAVEISRLYDTVIERHRSNAPPSWAQLLEYANICGAKMEQTDSIFVSVCDLCGNEFGLDEPYCPHCRLSEKERWRNIHRRSVRKKVG